MENNQNGNAKTIDQQKKEARKGAREELEALENRYLKCDSVSRINKSMRALAGGIKITNDTAKDAYYFKHFKLWESRAYGEFESCKSYACEKFGIRGEVQEKAFMNALDYRARAGAVLLGKKTGGSKGRFKTSFQKIETLLLKTGGELTADEAGKSVSILLKTVLLTHGINLHTFCEGIIASVNKIIEDAESAESDETLESIPASDHQAVNV